MRHISCVLLGAAVLFASVGLAQAGKEDRLPVRVAEASNQRIAPAPATRTGVGWQLQNGNVTITLEPVTNLHLIVIRPTDKP